MSCVYFKRQLDYALGLKIRNLLSVANDLTRMSPCHLEGLVSFIVFLLFLPYTPSLFYSLAIFVAVRIFIKGLILSHLLRLYFILIYNYAAVHFRCTFTMNLEVDCS